MAESVSRWSGCALTLVVAVSTVALAVDGRLTLYVHPRYAVFTTVLAVVALLGIAFAVAVVPRDPGDDRADHEHGHEHDHSADHAHPTSRRRTALPWRAAGGALLIVLTAVALVIVPPAGLSSSLRQDRGLVTSARALDDTEVPDLTGGDLSTLTVKDWAILLRQAGPEATVGQKVSVSGYVLDEHDDDVFYLARMMITCCAVDAQPVGIPVHRPGWRSTLTAGSWVQLDGTFVATTDDRYGAYVEPATLTPIAEPRDPYVF